MENTQKTRRDSKTQSEAGGVAALPQRREAGKKFNESEWKHKKKRVQMRRSLSVGKKHE